MDLYGHLSGKQEKNLTCSTWQVTNTAYIVPSGMLQHGRGNVFKGFCYCGRLRDGGLRSGQDHFDVFFVFPGNGKLSWIIAAMCVFLRDIAVLSSAFAVTC